MVDLVWFQLLSAVLFVMDCTGYGSPFGSPDSDVHRAYVECGQHQSDCGCFSYGRNGQVFRF
ncbi:MAG: hypothetical protein CM1200mP27_12230 [Chloroflexota bacterium]|nr:MAG: hypothetical protein CM1200mP27_12230 [Chloroflexota bacterium]